MSLCRGTVEGANCAECPFATEGRPTNPVVSEYAEDPAWIIIGEGPGFNEVRQGRPFCLVPETLVLMADLTWKPIGQVMVGDRILAVDEFGTDANGISGYAARKWRVAEVTATHLRVAETLAVETDRGSLLGSADHPVLTKHGERGHWLEMGKLLSQGKTGRCSRIAFLGKPWEQLKSYEAAWLSGFLDGEGHVIGSRPDLQRSRKRRAKFCKVGFSQNSGATYDRAVSMVKALGYDLNAKEESRAKGVVCNRVTIRGDLATTMRFLGEVRPERLVDNFQVAIEGKSMRALDEARVFSRKPIGVRELVDITTTTGTFIANGFVVHNCGASGQVVNELLKKIGRPREHLYVGNATLCIPPMGTPVEVRERAAECCKPRMLSELAQFPGKPVLTLGAIAARAVIPKPTLDAIDPPDVPKSKKRTQKERQREDRKADKRRQKKLDKIAVSRFRKAEKTWMANVRREIKRKNNGRVPDAHYWELPEQARVRGQLWKKAQAEAPRVLEQKLAEEALKKKNKPKKPPKKKPIKITDIVGTLFDVDVDGTGIRPVIPAIHPAALLRGGGATIGGSHTPDMAYVNLMYDAAKVDALSKGKDIRLRFDCEYEVQDSAKATQLFVNALQDAMDCGRWTLDLETYVDDVERHHALMAYIAKIRVIGIATERFAIAVAWDILEPWALRLFQLVLMSVPLGTHHGLYDRTVLRNRHYNFVIPVIGIDPGAPMPSDSLYAHHASFPGNAHRLQVVAAQFYGVTPWKSEFVNQEETLDKLADYCSKDTLSTHKLIPALEVWVQRSKTEKVYARDRKMMEIASRMHLIGQPVNREINSQLVSTFTRLSREAKKKVEAQATDPKIVDRVKHKLALLLAGKKRKKDEERLSPLREMALEAGKKLDEFEALYKFRKEDLDDERWFWKINNSKHIAAFLQAIDAPLTAVTEQGQISTKKEVLEALVDVPVVRDLLEYRENDKMLDFVGPIFDRLGPNGEIQSYGFADEFDRIHPIWSIHKISGRWAGSEPMGTSNPPREKTKKIPFGTTLSPDAIITGFICECGAYQGAKHDGHEFKPKFIEYAVRPTTKRQIVAKKGRVIIGFDFAQIEARILALISGDPFMCDVFGRDGDLHTECAIEVFPGFKDKTASERKMMRTVCKTLEYATWYGAADEKVWKGLLKEGYNYRLADVVGSLNRLRRKMSGIIAWQRDTIARASLPPYELRDFVSGRRRVWPMGQVEASEALNIVPQSTGAAIMNMGMEKMDDRIVDRGYQEAYCISQIHDAAYFEIWEDDVDLFSKDLTDCFECEQTNEVNGKTVKFPIEVGFGPSMFDV